MRLHYIYIKFVVFVVVVVVVVVGGGGGGGGGGGVQNPLLHFCTKQNWYHTMPPGWPTPQPCPPEDPGCSNYLSLLSVWSQLPQFEAPYHLNIFCATKGCRIGRQQNRTEMYRGYFKRLTFALMCDEHHSPQSHYLGSIICSQFISWWESCFHTIADKHCISLRKPLGVGLKCTSAESFWQWSPQPLHHLNHPVFLKSPGTSTNPSIDLRRICQSATQHLEAKAPSCSLQVFERFWLGSLESRQIAWWVKPGQPNSWTPGPTRVRVEPQEWTFTEAVRRIPWGFSVWKSESRTHFKLPGHRCTLLVSFCRKRMVQRLKCQWTKSKNDTGKVKALL